jgi:hypothetical protein
VSLAKNKHSKNIQLFALVFSYSISLARQGKKTKQKFVLLKTLFAPFS